MIVACTLERMPAPVVPQKMVLRRYGADLHHPPRPALLRQALGERSARDAGGESIIDSIPSERVAKRAKRRASEGAPILLRPAVNRRAGGTPRPNVVARGAAARDDHTIRSPRRTTLLGRAPTRFSEGARRGAASARRTCMGGAVRAHASPCGSAQRESVRHEIRMVPRYRRESYPSKCVSPQNGPSHEPEPRERSGRAPVRFPQ